LRICLVSYEYPPDVGGEATYTRSLAVGLAGLGHEVLLLIPERGHLHDDSDEITARRVPIKVLGIPMLKVASFTLGASRELRRLNSEKRVDITHVTFDYPSLPIPLDRFDIPTVMTVHHLHLVEALSMLRAGGDLTASLPTLARDFFTTLTERAFLAGADSVIAVSRFTRDSLVRYGGMVTDRIKVIPNGIDLGPFLSSVDTGSLRERLGLGSRPVVLFVGRLGPAKGLDDLIRAFGRVKPRIGSTCLVLVGSGAAEYSTRLKNLATSLGIGSDVILTGRVDQTDLHEAYAMSSVVALPSLMEGFGISLLEAMASGKPCVATRVGAIPEIVLPQRAGTLVDPGNPDALSNALAEVLADPEEARMMGERGREFVTKAFTVERMVDETLAVYQQVAKSR